MKRRTYRDMSLPPEVKPGHPVANREYAETLGNWMLLGDIAQTRRFLEAHTDLLSGAAELLLGFGIRQDQAAGRDPGRYWLRLDILREVKARGNTRGAIRQAYIDNFGALAAGETPSWLSDALDRISAVGGQDASVRVAALRTALARAEQDRSVVPEVVAALRSRVADEAADLPNVDLREIASQRERALGTFTLDDYPRQYAALHKELGLTYVTWSEAGGINKSDGLARAATHFDRALDVYARDTFPEQWGRGRVQMGLGALHAARNDKQRARQYLEAAQTVFSPRTHPDEWQQVQELLAALDQPPMSLSDFLDRAEGSEILSREGAEALRKELGL